MNIVLTFPLIWSTKEERGETARPTMSGADGGGGGFDADKGDIGTRMGAGMGGR